jgi:thioredoxin-dependent peroxiredoxin
MAKIPAFSLPGSDGKTWSSKELKGSTYVLYFYPKDSTPGCTTEACDFRDNFARLAMRGVKLFGISPDSLKSHANFIAKQELTFPLLTDAEHQLAEKLGVWIEKSMYGRTYMGIDRSTFLVGADGTIVEEWRSVKVPGHVDAVVAAVEEHFG